MMAREADAVDALPIFSEKGFHPAEEIADRPTHSGEVKRLSVKRPDE